MKKSKYSDFLKAHTSKKKYMQNSKSEYLQNNLASYDNDFKLLKDKRQLLLSSFPYSTVIEGVYEEHDGLSRFCWNEFGPKDCAKCPGPYYGCNYYPLNKEDEDEFPPHSHSGNWTSLWLGKFGYDFGYEEYFFRFEVNRDCFLAAVPNLKFW